MSKIKMLSLVIKKKTFSVLYTEDATNELCHIHVFNIALECTPLFL